MHKKEKRSDLFSCWRKLCHSPVEPQDVRGNKRRRVGQLKRQVGFNGFTENNMQIVFMLI